MYMYFFIHVPSLSNQHAVYVMYFLVWALRFTQRVKLHVTAGVFIQRLNSTDTLVSTTSFANPFYKSQTRPH